MPVTAERLSTLLEMAKKKHYEALEGAWVEMAGEPVTDPNFYAALGQQLVKFHENQRLEEMVNLHVSALNEAGRPLEASRILRSVLRVAPELTGLRDNLIKSMQGAYGDRPTTQGYIESSGLATADNLGQALRMFEVLLTTSEGSVYRHKSWGIGVVQKQDLEGKSVTIDFGGKRKQTFSFSGIREFLERIPPNHILAEIARDPEAVRKKAQDDPVGLIRQSVENLGKKVKQSDLKAIFVPGVFTAAQWSRWWTNSKDKLRLDPMMEVGLGAHGEISLRDEPRSASSDVLVRFEKAETHHARQQAVREAMRFAKSGALSPEELGPLSEHLRDGYEAADEPADALTWAYLGDELASAAPGDSLWRPDLDAIVKEAGADADVVAALPLADHQMRVLNTIRETDPHHFGEMCVRLIDGVTPSLSKWMMKQLLSDEKTHRAAEDSLAQLLHDPGANTEAFLWAMQQVLGGPWAHLSVANEAPILLHRVLDYLEDLQRKVDREEDGIQAHRGLATRVRNTLEENRHALILHTMRDLPVEEAKRLYKKMMTMIAFSDAWRTAVTSSLQSVRGDLEEARQSDQETEVLYVTAGKLREKQSELQHIRSVEIPENSKDIQTAREHGDLRENAEYKAAKERQVLLHRRAEELESLLSRAQPINPAGVTGEVVVPGTRVHIRNRSTNEEETYTLLGLWDAEPEQGIISYHSPFGSQFLKHHAGDKLTVKLPSGESHEYELLRIEKAV